MLEVKIEAEGHTLDDLIQAIDEAKARLQAGNTSGFDSNDTGNFSFESSGSEVEEYAIAIGGDTDNLDNERYTNYCEAQDASKSEDRVVGLNNNGDIVT